MTGLRCEKKKQEIVDFSEKELDVLGCERQM